MSKPTIADGARALRLPENEIAAVQDSPAGLIVETTDGNACVVVPPESPDAEGKTGVMFLRLPEKYQGSFPVYTQPVEPDAEPEPKKRAGSR